MNKKNDLDLGTIAAWLDRNSADPPSPAVLAGVNRAMRSELARVQWRHRWRGILSGVGVAAAVLLAVWALRPGPSLQTRPVETDLTFETLAAAVEFTGLFEGEDGYALVLSNLVADVDNVEAAVRQSVAPEGVPTGEHVLPALEPGWREVEELPNEPPGPTGRLDPRGLPPAGRELGLYPVRTGSIRRGSV